MTTVVYLYEQKFRSWRKRLAGVYRYAKEHGWNVRVIEISELKGGLERTIGFWKASGAIVEGGVVGSPRLRSFLRSRFPTVFCDFDANRIAPGRSGVIHDSVKTAEIVVAELLKRNCASYGFIGFDVNREWSKDRERVFLSEMAKAGVPARTFDPTAGTRFRDATEFYGALEDWLGALPRPCGIFAVNDEIGEHVLRAARNRGIAVPDEMVVVGVDNDELLCESTEPTLSSVGPDFELSGRVAAEILDGLLANPRAKAKIVTFSGGQLVVRESMRKYRYRDFAALKAIEFIRLQACSGIKVADVVRAMGTSRRSAEQRFFRFIGHAIREEIENVRFRRACELVLKPRVQLESVCESVGYGSPRSLREVFYRRTGLSLSAWRARERRAQKVPLRELQ